jgi:hypothetical protein
MTGLSRGARGRACAKGMGILCLTIVTLLIPATVSLASVELTIQITGLSFKYDESQSGSLFDANSIAGGHGSIGEATRVSQIDFWLGTQMAGSLLYNEGLYCDFLVQGIYNIPKTGGIVNTTSSGPDFGFDLLSSTRGLFLALDLDTATVTYTSNKVGNCVRFSFLAGGPSADLLSQDLPFGLEIDPEQPISVVVSSLNVSSRTEAGDYVTAFSTTGGTAAVYADQMQVPEPASFAILLGIGMIGLEIRAWRQRRRNRRVTFSPIKPPELLT